MSGSREFSFRILNGPNGYGLVTKSLHWITVLLIVLQFSVGYLMDPDDGSGRGRGRGRSGESGRGRGRGSEDGYDIFDDTLLTVHVALGVLILLITVIRLVWRRTTPLPPWASSLTAFERKLSSWTERALYTALIAMPLSGIVLILSGDDDVLPLHIAAQVLFFGAIACHLGLILKHTLIDRDGLVRRMTWKSKTEK